MAMGAMAARIAGIHPACRVELIEDPVTPENVRGELLHGFDVVIDAIDNVRARWRSPQSAVSGASRW